MKKFISFVMSAAMVASLVPATAFAKGEVTATARVVDSLNITKDEAQNQPTIAENAEWTKDVPELQLKITNTDYRKTQPEDETKLDVTVTLDGAKFTKKNGDPLPAFTAANDATIKAALADLVSIKYDKDRGGSAEEKFFENTTDGKAIVKVDVNGNVVKKISENVDRDPDFADVKNKDGVAWLLDQGRTFTVTSGADTSPEPIWLIDGVNDPKQLFDGTDLLVSNSEFLGHLVNDAAKLFMDNETGAGNANATVLDGTAGATKKFKVEIDKTANASGTLTAITEASLAAGDTTFDFDKDKKIAFVTTPTDVKQGDLEVVSAGDGASPIDGITWEVKDYDEDQVTYTFTGRFAVDDVIVVDLCSKLDKTGAGKNATVSVDSKAVNSDDLVYVSVEGRGITATTRKVGSIAEEEFINLESDIKVSSTVGNFADNQWFELKLSKGFEFNKFSVAHAIGLDDVKFDGNTAYVLFDSGSATDQDSFTIDKNDVEIESTTAKSGATCTMTVKALDKVVTNVDGDLGAAVPDAFKATTTVEILKVVDYKVILSVDEDEDVPVIYSGVDVDNYGLTDDSDHWSLEVTAKESFPGAWSMRKGFNFELPEHVYVADIDGVDVTGTDNFYWNGKVEQHDVSEADVEAAFWNAYREGSHVNLSLIHI